MKKQMAQTVTMSMGRQMSMRMSMTRLVSAVSSTVMIIIIDHHY